MTYFIQQLHARLSVHHLTQVWMLKKIPRRMVHMFRHTIRMNRDSRGWFWLQCLC